MLIISNGVDGPDGEVSLICIRSRDEVGESLKVVHVQSLVPSD